MNEVSTTEMEIIMRIRDLRPYEKIEIKLKENRLGEVVCTITSNLRIEYEI